MVQRVAAVFEDGVFRPMKPIRLRNGARVDLVVDDARDEEYMAMLKLAEQSPSYAFLHDPAEDIYTLEDGKPVEPA